MPCKHSEFHHHVVSVFEANAARYSDHIALQDENNRYTYRTLNNRVNQFASCFKKKSVGSGDFVAILMDPSADFVICILAVLKIGASYIPLDSLAPKSRLQEILQDAKPKLLVTSQEYLSLFQDNHVECYQIKQLHLESVHEKETNLDTIISPESSCYMMYTSGSTGKPKGVVIPHRAVINLAKDNALHLGPKHNMAQFSNLAFDGSTFDIWTSLLNAASLIVIPQSVRGDYQKLKVALRENQIKSIFLPTGYFHQLVNSHPESLDGIDKILFGGEAINPNIVRTFIAYRKKRQMPIVLVNGYGPTEATGHVCRQIIDENSEMTDSFLSSIGQPIHNVKLYLLDKDLNEVDEGELCISGASLAIGYHNKAEIEYESKFISNPFQQDSCYSHLYKTGDKFKRLITGELIYQSRLDDQVKIGGYRIYLAEIEQQLIKHESIKFAAVTSELSGGIHKILIAYLMFTSESTIIEAEDIRKFLSQSLPVYMLPTQYRMIKELPLSAIGKVDRKKLEKLPHIDLSFHVDTSSESEIEEDIKQIWTTLLNRQHIAVHKNLFELGANSLLLMEACSRINQKLQTDLSITDLFKYPSIHQLSRYLEGDLITHLQRKYHHADSNNIAVIGMSCRFPKANNIEEFWERLCAGEDCLMRFEHQSGVPVRGIISDIEQFDASFFGFNAMDASITDPQQRIFLECAWEALEHAAIAPTKIGTELISVFAGMSDSTYLQENLMKNTEIIQNIDELQKRIATNHSMLSTQISYRLNLKGKSLNVNTACSTGLIAVEQACQDLLLGQSDIALAGACSIVVPQLKPYKYQKGGILSPDGYCKPFSDEANGTVFSNGIGVVVLKRLKDAIASKNTIYAVIKGRGVNNDGIDKLGFAAPSVNGQMSCIRDALMQANITPQDIGFLEAHGTATALGDVVEMNAVTSVYREQTDKNKFCALGSVKANIGHTDVAAGIAGLIKTVLCLYHRKIPPLINFSEPNPKLSLHQSPFFVNTKLLDWESSYIRNAAVSSFGVGGTNAHFILSEYKESDCAYKRKSVIEELMLFSAKTEPALRQKLQQFSKFFNNIDDNVIENVAYTLKSGREDFQWRCFSVGKTAAEIAQQLEKCPTYFVDEEKHQSIVFLFSGQGTQYPGMALELMEKIPRFKSYVEDGAHLAKPYLKQDIIGVLKQSDNKQMISTEYTQPILFIIEYALARLLIDCGIRPSALMGHSIGEYVAACIAGIFSFEDAISLVCERGILMSTASKGAMLAIESDIETCLEFKKIANVEIALHHTQQHCVVAGSSDDITVLEQYLLSKKQTYKKLNVSHAFHSHMMEPLEKSFKMLFSQISLLPPTIPVVSNVTGIWLTATEAIDPDYWYRHLRHTVRFYDGVKLLLNDKQPLFIEIGPGQSLCQFVKTISGNETMQTHLLPSFNSKNTEFSQFLKALGTIWSRGEVVNFAPIDEEKNCRNISLPTYPFQKKLYWINPDERFENSMEEATIFKPFWSRQKKVSDSKFQDGSNLQERTWIIFRDNKGLADKAISILKKQKIHPIIVNCYGDNLKLETGHFLLKLGNIQQCRILLRKIKSKLVNPVIFYAPSYIDGVDQLLSKKELNKQLERGFYGLLYLLQAWTEQFKEEQNLSVIMLTSCMQKIIGTEKVNPSNAMLKAYKVIAQENRTFRFTLIDLNPEEHPQNNKNLVFELLRYSLELQQKRNFSILNYRNGYQWEQTYIPLLIKNKTHRLQEGGIYLFTGGLGGIALACCEAIAETITNPVFILLSRRKIVPENEWESVLKNLKHPQYEEISKLNKIRTLGGKFLFHQVDILKRSQLKEIINQCQKNFGKINGVIHAAGIVKPQLAFSKSKKEIEEVFAAKIFGTCNLIQALQHIQVDFVVLKSSLATILGGIELFDYCAANACLEAFVDTDLFSAQSIISVNWNTWQRIGMASDAYKLKVPTTRLGNNAISLDEGKKLLVEILSLGEEHIAISKTDIQNELERNAQPPVSQKNYESLIENQQTNSKSILISNDDDVVDITIMKLWQQVLGIKDIDIHDDFFELGGHSLNGLNLIEKINSIFHCDLPTTQLYKTPTIHNFKRAILDNELNNQSRNLSQIVVPIKTMKRTSPNLFLCHPISGFINCFNAFAKQNELPVSLYGLQDPSIKKNYFLYNSIKDMAKNYLSAIQEVQPFGPYYLLGYSFGGNLIHEIAHLLAEDGQKIKLLAMIDSWAIFNTRNYDEQSFRKQLKNFDKTLPKVAQDLAWEREKLLLSHDPNYINQDIVLFKAKNLLEDYRLINDPFNGWKKFTGGKLNCFTIEGDHLTIMNSSSIKKILGILHPYFF